MKVTNNYFDKLRDIFSSTDGTIYSFEISLDNLIMISYLEEYDVKKHNELMFSSNPLYIHRSFEDIKLLEIISDILNSDKYESFNTFKSFINYINNNESFIEINSFFKSIDQSKRILAVEGKYSTDFSDKYKTKTDNMINNLSINLDDTVKNYKNLYTGKTICAIIDSLNEKKEESYLLFKTDIVQNYPSFNISTIDQYKENDDLEDFCIAVNEFNKTFSSIKKGVK